jgi:hypothetical protein
MRAGMELLVALDAIEIKAHRWDALNIRTYNDGGRGGIAQWGLCNKYRKG